MAQERDGEALRRVLGSITGGERAMIASELRALSRSRSNAEPIHEPAHPEFLPDLARRARRLFEVGR